MSNYNVIVIGGGPAGLAAAQRAASHGLSVLILEAAYTGGHTVKAGMIEDYPGFPDGILGEELADRIESAAINKGAKILHEKVTKMSLGSVIKIIITDRGSYSADAVIIAAGVRPREIGLDNERGLAGMGIFRSAQKEGERLSGKCTAVVGFGNDACEQALILSKLCPKVYLICTEPTLKASKKYVDEISASDNISTYYNCLIAAVTEGMFFLEDMTVVNRVTTEFVKVKTEGLFVAMGYEPDTDVFLGQVRMNDDGAVIADGKMKTSEEGVFAAGSVREDAMQNVLGAVSDGYIAADSANEYIIKKHSR